MDSVLYNITLFEWIHVLDHEGIPNEYDHVGWSMMMYYNWTYFDDWPPEPVCTVEYNLGENSESSIVKARIMHWGADRYLTRTPADLDPEERPFEGFLP